MRRLLIFLIIGLVLGNFVHGFSQNSTIDDRKESITINTSSPTLDTEKTDDFKVIVSVTTLFLFTVVTFTLKPFNRSRNLFFLHPVFYQSSYLVLTPLM
ncbi:hypothetical protein [Thalassobacillus pellis]|uniref:hypothetical protein n=1 Tax=Thalassobacillus pellis TaxID=748008 RepID=UPI00195F67C1|nr:hypothetical protein [Thalassobacillus pellis]MBM7553497.1 hypothetical protein [Thalassobacillus pellis]